MMMKRGISLLEMLVVLSVSSVILTLSVLRYQAYQQTADVAQIKHHVQLIFAALLDYYHHIGCNNAGVFPYHDEDVFGQLGLTFNHDAPYISNYHAIVIDTGHYTGTTNKPIYQLSVRADVNSTDPQKLTTLAKAVDAQATTTSPLTWMTLSNHGLAKMDNSLWLLDSMRANFTNTESFSDDNRCAQ